MDFIYISIYIFFLAVFSEGNVLYLVIRTEKNLHSSAVQFKTEPQMSINR